MSEYEKVKTQYLSEDCLRRALQTVSAQLEIEFEEGENLHLYGYKGDRRSQTAQFVIRREYVGAAANDIGFVNNGDGSYSLYISQYDQRQEGREDLLAPIRQQYGLEVLKAKAEAQGMDVSNVRVEDGKLVGEIKPKRRKAKKMVRGKGRRRLRIRS